MNSTVATAPQAAFARSLVSQVRIALRGDLPAEAIAGVQAVLDTLAPCIASVAAGLPGSKVHASTVIETLKPLAEGLPRPSFVGVWVHPSGKRAEVRRNKAGTSEYAVLLGVRDGYDAGLLAEIVADGSGWERDTTPAVPAADATPGLTEIGASRVITNRRGGKCVVCDAKVAAGDGHAALVRGSWCVACKPCASTTDAERRAVVSLVEAVLIDADERAGTTDLSAPVIRVAVPSRTATNDLDFFELRPARSDRGASITRVIGGNREVRLAGTDAERSAVQVAVETDLVEAMRRYGRELGVCGRCGRTLTDETSRADGLGPDCASKL